VGTPIQRAVEMFNRKVFEHLSPSDPNSPLFNALRQPGVILTDDESRDLLSKAAILGNNFDINILKLFSGKNEGYILDILDKLSERGISEQDVLSGRNFHFLNTAIKQNIYNASNKKELQDLHKKVAELLQSAEKAKLGKTYAQIMYHLKEAGETDKLGSLLERSELPAYVKEAFSGESAAAIEEVIESHLSEKSRKILPKTLFSFKSVWINSQLYSVDNEVYINSLESIDQDIRHILENDLTLTITILEQNILINGQALNKDEVYGPVASDIVSLFIEYGIESITFKKGLTRKELNYFFSLLSKKQEYLKNPYRISKASNIKNIKINKVRYKKVSDMHVRQNRAEQTLKEIIAHSSKANNLFSSDDKGISVNPEMLSDLKEAINSLAQLIDDISKKDIGQAEKSAMILELLQKTKTEFMKNDPIQWARGKALTGKLLLSLEPLLRAKIIQESPYCGAEDENTITDILSGLEKEDIVKILSEGEIKKAMPPEEFNEFIKTILGSKNIKNSSYEEISSLFEKAGIKNELPEPDSLEETLNSFSFSKTEKEAIETEKTELWDKRSLESLRPFTENLIKKKDKKLIEKFAKSFSENLTSSSPVLRIFAIDAIGKILEVLFEKDIFDVSADIINMLIAQLKTEENINVYLELLKYLETIVSTLIKKQNFSLLATVLLAIREEVFISSQKPEVFKNCIGNVINRIFSVENIDKLLTCCIDENKNNSSDIINVIAQFGEDVINPIIEFLTRENDKRVDPMDTYMKKKCVAAIMNKIGEKGLHRLMVFLNDDRPFVVENIIEVLGNMNDEAVIPCLEQASKYPAREVQMKAKNILKKLKENRDTK